jgi:hypothetical protein
MLNIYTKAAGTSGQTHSVQRSPLSLVIISMAAFPGMPSLATEGDSKVIFTGEVLTGGPSSTYSI